MPGPYDSRGEKVNEVNTYDVFDSHSYHSIGGRKHSLDQDTGAADAEICRNAWDTPHVSKQRSAGASDSNDGAHQGECEHHSGRQPVRAEMRMAA
jgi:hypothetical protein